MREDFNVTIKETSIADSDLTAKERIKLKDTSSATPLDSVVTDETPLIISPIAYAVLDVHNEKAKGDKDYTQLLVLDANGNKYTTGSQSFMNSFFDIWNEMDLPNTGEAFDISVFRKPSKNYAGKSFISCTIL